MVTDEKVLHFFRDEITPLETGLFTPVPLGFNTPLQSYAEWDELCCAIEDFRIKFGVDTSTIDFTQYYPWVKASFFGKLFTFSAKKSNAKPLTIRMFAASAKAGRWLFD